METGHAGNISKREILRDFNCPTNSPDSSYAKFPHTEGTSLLGGEEGSQMNQNTGGVPQKQLAN